MTMVAAAATAIPGLRPGTMPETAGHADRVVRAFAPDLRQNPRAALRDMRLTDPIRESLAKAAKSAGYSLVDDVANDDYASDGKIQSRRFSVLKSATDEIVLLQVPDWIATENVGALNDVRDALTNQSIRVVRIVAPGVDRPNLSLRRTMPQVWRKEADIDLAFVDWGYVKEVAEEKSKIADVFGTGGDASATAAPTTTVQTIKKVFISSTGKDLSEYREAAKAVCLDLSLYPLMMEHFEAMGAGATAGSLKKLKDATLYVGIFAHRYGYIEEGQNKSVTELEFDNAEGLERLCFLHDSDHPWPPSAIDQAHHKEMEAFRQRVEKQLIRKTFTTVDDFRAKLQAALLPHLK
jgi:hypothetical protein